MWSTQFYTHTEWRDLITLLSTKNTTGYYCIKKPNCASAISIATRPRGKEKRLRARPASRTSVSTAEEKGREGRKRPTAESKVNPAWRAIDTLASVRK